MNLCPARVTPRTERTSWILVTGCSGLTGCSGEPGVLCPDLRAQGRTVPPSRDLRRPHVTIWTGMGRRGGGVSATASNGSAADRPPAIILAPRLRHSHTETGQLERLGWAVDSGLDMDSWTTDIIDWFGPTDTCQWSAACRLSQAGRP